MASNYIWWRNVISQFLLYSEREIFMKNVLYKQLYFSWKHWNFVSCERYIGTSAMFPGPFVNPFGVSRNSCIYSRLIFYSALQTETHYAIYIPTVASFAHKRSATIALQIDSCPDLTHVRSNNTKISPMQLIVCHVIMVNTWCSTSVLPKGNRSWPYE